MAKTVETDDDHFPLRDALLKRTPDKVTIPPKPGQAAKHDNNSTTASRDPRSEDPGPRAKDGNSTGLKNRPKKRVLHPRHDNPLLNKISAGVSPKKMNSKLRQRPDDGDGMASAGLKFVEILDVDEEEQELGVTSGLVSLEPSRVNEQKSSRSKFQKIEVTRLHSREVLRRELIPKKPAQDTLRVRDSAASSRECIENGESEDESSSGYEGLSDFIVSDSSFLDEEDSTMPLPPPRSARRLVRGRRPSNLDESDKTLVAGKMDTTDARQPVNFIQKLRGSDPAELSYSEGRFDSSSVVTKLEPFESRGTSKSEIALFSELEDLTLGNVSSPRTKPLRNPREQNLRTPPGSPIKPIKLKSPSKKTFSIPSSAHRPSMDSFWNSEIINEWNDEYSPQKTIKTTQREVGGSPKKPSVKQNRAASDAKRMFSETKNQLAESFLAELDRTIAQGQISELSASTGGVKIIWSKKLNTTAGRANWKRETVKSAQIQGTVISYRHRASIELAEKVINDEERLLNVIAHEFCHLANFMISNIKTNPHGKEFKAWAAKCSSHFGDRGIEVTTKHSYEIDYKYVWECWNCGLEFKRHSKSIDPAKHQCGSCKSKLVQTKPVPRASTTAGGIKKVSEYQDFLKKNMSRVREENPGSPQKEVMGLVAKAYQEYKASKSKQIVLDNAKIGERKSEGGTPEECKILKILTRNLDSLDLTNA